MTAVVASVPRTDPLMRFLAGPFLAVTIALPVLPRSGFSVAHLMMLALMPVTVPAVWNLRFSRVFLVLCGAWFASAVFADVYHAVGLRQTTYAITQPVIVYLVYATVLWIYRSGWEQARRTTGWLVFGLLLAELVRHSPTEAADPWKYLYGQLVTLGVVLFVASRWIEIRSRWGVLALLAIATVNVLAGFRSLALIVLLALAIGLLTGRPGVGTRRWWVRIAGVAALVCVVAIPAYGHLASSGALGAEQRYKWTAQSQVTGGVVLGARPEIAASPVLIAASPVFGQGTGYTPDRETQARFFARLQEFGVRLSPAVQTFYFGDGAYLHSSFFQQWTDLGIATLPGLVAPLVMCVLALRAAFRRGSAAAGLAFGYVTLVLADQLVFAPWGRMAGTYVGWAAAAAVAYLAAGTDGSDADPPVRGTDRLEVRA